MFLHLISAVAFGGSLTVGLHPETPAERLTIRYGLAGEELRTVKADPASVTTIPDLPDDQWVWLELETPEQVVTQLLPPNEPKRRDLSSVPVQVDSLRPRIRVVDLDGRPVPGVHTRNDGGQLSSRRGWFATRPYASDLLLPGGWKVPFDRGAVPEEGGDVVLPVRRVPVPLEGHLYQGRPEYLRATTGETLRGFIDAWLPVGTFHEEWMDGETPRRRRIEVPRAGKVRVTELEVEAVPVTVSLVEGATGELWVSSLHRATGAGEALVFPRSRPEVITVAQRMPDNGRSRGTQTVLLEPGEQRLDIPPEVGSDCQAWGLRAVPEGLFVQQAPQSRRYRPRDAPPRAVDKLVWGMIVTEVNGTSLAGWNDRWFTAKRSELAGDLALSVLLDGETTTVRIPADEACELP